MCEKNHDRGCWWITERQGIASRTASVITAAEGEAWFIERVWRVRQGGDCQRRTTAALAAALDNHPRRESTGRDREALACGLWTSAARAAALADGGGEGVGADARCARRRDASARTNMMVSELDGGCATPTALPIGDYYSRWPRARPRSPRTQRVSVE